MQKCIAYFGEDSCYCLFKKETWLFCIFCEV